jgi:hypothetical protein
MHESVAHHVNISWLFVTFGDSGSRKQMTTGEEKVADWKILMNQWRNEHSCRDELSHHLVFTKKDEEPASFTLVRSEAGLARDTSARRATVP